MEIVYSRNWLLREEGRLRKYKGSSSRI